MELISNFLDLEYGVLNSYACTSNEACYSDYCQAGRCAGQLAQDAYCAVPSDCASGTCTYDLTVDDRRVCTNKKAQLAQCYTPASRIFGDCSGPQACSLNIMEGAYCHGLSSPFAP